MGNSSLIGYTSTGAPRIQKSAVIDTQFMIDNKGTKLVIGGLEKRDVVRVSGGLPILKDLPIIGWLFSTEQESTKRSQLVVVAEIVPEAQIKQQGAEFQKKAAAELVKAGETNKIGYRQYFIDGDR
jgi:type II secretory pathway component GspD/PulD (secretin)